MRTVADCASEIGVTPDTIHDWIRAGRVSAQKFGPHATLIHEAEWERFLATLCDRRGCTRAALADGLYCAVHSPRGMEGST